MPFIDSHAHLHDTRIINDMDAIMARAEKSGVRFCMSCATAEENFELTLDLSRRFKAIIPFFGIHPWFLDSLSDEWQSTLERYLETHVSGIGETGIDFTDKTADRDRQVTVFETHLMLAKEMGRPINIHVRKAWDTFIRILKKIGKLKVPGIIHSYSGSADMVPLFEKYNLFISFSGSVTNPGSKKVPAALKAVSENRFVLETDTPDIYPYIPDPHPLRLNEPANLTAIAKIAAERIGKDEEAFRRQAYENSCRVFGPLLEEEK